MKVQDIRSFFSQPGSSRGSPVVDVPSRLKRGGSKNSKGNVSIEKSDVDSDHDDPSPKKTRSKKDQGNGKAGKSRKPVVIEESDEEENDNEEPLPKSVRKDKPQQGKKRARVLSESDEEDDLKPSTQQKSKPSNEKPAAKLAKVEKASPERKKEDKPSPVEVEKSKTPQEYNGDRGSPQKPVTSIIEPRKLNMETPTPEKVEKMKASSSKSSDKKQVKQTPEKQEPEFKVPTPVTNERFKSRTKGQPNAKSSDVEDDDHDEDFDPKKKANATTSGKAQNDDTIWTHMKLKWAKEGNRMDASRRKESDANYDPRTLYVPMDFLNSLTPAMRQWWELKSKNFDTILFFKVGKFYEFYHWDACVAAKELGITFMRGEYAHNGFPEIAYSRFKNALVEKGYKVARIEQTETPDMLAERTKKNKLQKHEKVIKREVCEISTKGVRYASFQDERASNPFTPESVYLFGIVEKPSSGGSDFGVCFVDTTIGTFHIGQFCDDRHFSRLRTLFSHYVPAQILYERGKLSTNLQQIFNNMSAVRKDPLISDVEFWNAKKTLKFLAEQDYFREGDSGRPNWPTEIQKMLSESDTLGLTADENWELGLKSLGGVVWYLKRCLLEHDLLSQKRFEFYVPADIGSQDDADVSEILPVKCTAPKYMILDGITIRNLEILNGPLSLLSTLDRCGTNFGKRLLRHWLCLPLAIPEEIDERLDAVSELMQKREFREKSMSLLKSLPDLERLLSKMHYLGSAHRSKNHPESRAFFFEEVKYSRNKIADLLSALRGFKTCVKIITELKSVDDGLTSQLLLGLVDKFPALDDLLKMFDNAFDHQLASKEGKIKPKEGAIQEYDDAVQAVVDIEEEAEQYLKDISRKLGTRAVFFGSDKKRFQIEVSDKIKVPKSFEMSSSRKNFKRYYTTEAKEFLSSIQKAEAEREDILRDIARKIFERFDNHRDTWSQAVECIATLDVLISLSLFSESQEVMCRPKVSFSSAPFLNVVEGRHPCVASDTYIPNDSSLGRVNEEAPESGSFVILTGPNMGGKSTLMRQVGLLSILSQLGCFVPAEQCDLSVVDRIFTRLGANDNIGEGESTFYVEMSETSAILKHATRNSLLLIDELGRGTATYDGTAIAYAVAKDLSKRECRTLFSTHYHTLVEALQETPSTQMCHMACMVENENEEDPTQESITFLYKMISGPCPKSYGFNAARLAGISDNVIRVAHKKAKEMESSVSGVRSFTDICSMVRSKKYSLQDFASLKL